MSDELNSQLSAFIDDELTPEESELFVRRLCRDETLRRTAACYGTIGDVLRGESAVTAPSEFADAVMMAVEGQTVPALRPAPMQARRLMRHWGFAAASVALAAVALLTLPGGGPDKPDAVTANVAESIPTPTPTPAVNNPAEIADPEPVAIVMAADRADGSTRPDITMDSFAADSPDGIGPDYYNVPIVMPATAENRARLNNLLLQHLYSSGAPRQPVALRNVGFVTQTESQR